MAVEHSTLTGASLHEPKGVASAASGTVYVANGSGSGAWTALGTSTNPFGTQLYHVRDQVASGVASSSLTASTWNTRRLQTEVTDEITSSSLTSNQISLPSGTYLLLGSAVGSATYITAGAFIGAMYSKLRFRNITSGSTLLTGPTFYSGPAYTQGTLIIPVNLSIAGRFTLGSTSTLELQNYVSGSGYTFDAGKAASASENEVYADLLIWKIA